MAKNVNVAEIKLRAEQFERAVQRLVELTGLTASEILEEALENELYESESIQYLVRAARAAR